MPRLNTGMSNPRPGNGASVANRSRSMHSSSARSSPARRTSSALPAGTERDPWRPARGVTGVGRPSNVVCGGHLSVRANVVIIGGGVIGSSIAWHLQQRGVEDVLLIEAASRIASETSAAGAGYVSLWNREPELERYALKFWPDRAQGRADDFQLRRNGFLEISDASLDLAEMFRAQINLPRTDPQAARLVSLDELAKLVP